MEQNEERVCNYERYRVLIHNEANGGKNKNRLMKNDLRLFIIDY